MLIPRFADTVASHEAMDEQSQPEKRRYSAPKLTIFGSLAEFLERHSLGVQPGGEGPPARLECAASWYSLVLTEGVGELVEDVWKIAWEVSRSAGEPDFSSAIFQKIRPGKGQTLYFSPSAEPLAQTFDASACDRPSPADISLIAGDERAWQIHFGRVFARPKVPFAETRPSDLPEPTLPSPLQ